MNINKTCGIAHTGYMHKWPLKLCLCVCVCVCVCV